MTESIVVHVDPGPFELICSRDDFAKAAMQAMVGYFVPDTPNEETEEEFVIGIARRAYAMADAMIAERSKG